ncbi:hypothetical protein GCM10023216_27960 [Isoptericola chiayiensis]|uniref:DUF6318 domain-containing protein n=1 Tax=Isoptericola chiayiensis TaxID=579446 RepID=A0ABP8YN64_9MICO|nr:DUF6318 family protein [Isoptericola chiayiensis]NOW01414.1 hypothetical protein [Isoptericola chiayiensis]
MTRTTRHHLTSTATLLTSVLLVAGCTDDDAEPEATSSELPLPASVTASPSDEPSPTPSPSPSGPEKPERPAAMDKKDGDGAAAAVKYILALEQPMMVTGDTAEWEKRSHRSCDYCASRLDQAKTIARRGDTFSGGGFEVTVETVYQRDAVTAIWPVDVKVAEHETTIRDSSGEVVFDSEGSRAERRVEVALKDGEWVLVEMAEIPE